MKTKRLGNSDLDITPIGFGAWAIGGSRWEVGWGAQDDSNSPAATPGPPGPGEANPPLPRRREVGRERLLAEGVGAADRSHDAGEDRAISRRRLAPDQPRLSGAASVPQPPAGEPATDHRRPSRPYAGRGRRRLGSAQSSGHRGDRGGAPARSN